MDIMVKIIVELRSFEEGRREGRRGREFIVWFQ